MILFYNKRLASNTPLRRRKINISIIDNSFIYAKLNDMENSWKKFKQRYLEENTNTSIEGEQDTLTTDDFELLDEPVKLTELDFSVPLIYPRDKGLLGDNGFKTQIKHIIVEDGVETILQGAFSYCSSLISITIPSSVTSIGEEAFYHCASLTSITIPNSVTSIGEAAFSHCESLTSITIPDSVTKIDDGAFSYCPSLTSITIPNGVTSIDRWTFYECTSLTSITMPSSVTSIGFSAFDNCESLISITIPSSVTSIGDFAFSECTSLIIYAEAPGKPEGWNTRWNPDNRPVVWDYKKATKNNKNKLSEDAFELLDEPEVLDEPVELSEIDFSAPLIYPRDKHFLYDDDFKRQIKHIIVEDGVETIDDNAFYYCTSLISITIPSSVTSIGNYAFYHCTSLTSVTIPRGVTTIGEYAFMNCPFLTSVTIPDSVTTIGYQAFYNCESLTSIEIPSSVTTIGERTFMNCASLTAVTIPNSVTEIGESAFYNCKSLTSITIPDSVTSIGGMAFYDCKSITSVTIPGSVTLIGDFAFYNCPRLTIYAEATSKPTGWTKWWNRSNRPVVWNYKNPIKNNENKLNEDIFELLDEPVKLTEIDFSMPIIYPRDKHLLDDEEFRKQVKHIIVENGVETISEWDFSSCRSLISITIPNSVTSIGGNAFSYCTSLTSITIPNSVTSIGNSAFRYCTALKSITIPSSVTSIGEWAFSYCEPLTSVTIPGSVTSIGDSAFSHCKALTSIIIPNSVTSIGIYAFYNCPRLTIYAEASSNPTGWNAGWNPHGRPVVWNYKKSIKNNENKLNEDAFEVLDEPVKLTEIDFNVPIIYPRDKHFLDDEEFKTQIKHIVVEDGTKTIDKYAFYDCRSLASITIPSSVTSIGESAFMNCDSLTSIKIPGRVTSIGDWAFYMCPSLTSITIPDSVTNIGKRAFSNCSSLTAVTIPNSVTIIGDYAFSHCLKLTIYAEAPGKPDGWAKWWNRSNRPVFWGIIKKSEKYYISGEELEESKQDIERFTKWAGKELADRYFKQKSKMKSPYNDITWVMKNYTNTKEFEEDVYYYEKIPTRSDINKKGKEGAKLIYSDKNWKVYKIDTYEAAVKYGKNTQWCLTGTNTSVGDDISAGREHYNKYVEDGYELYFYIYNKNNDKYALIYANDNDWQLFDSADFLEVCSNMSSPPMDTWNPQDTQGYHPDFPKVKGLPDINKVYDDYAKEVGIFDDTDNDTLNEVVETNSFTPYTAGYILEDGSLLVMDEYHGEEEIREFYPEYSNTHPEEDTCVRLYGRPNEAQYKRLEEIIDYYLNHENYCKVEIWNKPGGKYSFYEVYSLYEGACEDTTWDEKIGNWTGYKLVQIIKNYFAKRVIEGTIKKSINKNTGDKMKESLKSKGNITDKKIIKYVEECIDTLNKLGFKIEDDLELHQGDSLHTFGTFSFPKDDKSSPVLTLNKYMFEEPEESIKNTIYHELCHYLVYKDGVEADVYFYDDLPGKWKYNTTALKKYPANFWKHHGYKWKEYADRVGRAVKHNITRTNSYATHTGVGQQYDKSVKYVVKCNNCNSEIKYTKRTEFVKDPNVIGRSGSYKWSCGKCKAKGQWSVKEVNKDEQ